MAEVRYENATRVYPGAERPAVDALTLAIGDGEFVVMAGPSGCGTTTALRMLAGLEELDEGSILIGGQDMADVPSRDRDVAVVFQNYALYPSKTVGENMGFALRMRGIGEEESARRVREAARLLDLEPLLDRTPRNLSGGQRQRVALGRAIVREPKVFCMDEPLSNLDAALRAATQAQISELQRRLRVTTVYVTHDQAEAMAMGERVAVLRDGRLQQFATPAELYDRPANAFVASFIGSPAMNLFDAVVEQDGIRLAGRPPPAGRHPAARGPGPPAGRRRDQARAPVGRGRRPGAEGRPGRGGRGGRLDLRAAGRGPGQQCDPPVRAGAPAARRSHQGGRGPRAAASVRRGRGGGSARGRLRPGWPARCTPPQSGYLPGEMRHAAASVGRGRDGASRYPRGLRARPLAARHLMGPVGGVLPRGGLRADRPRLARRPDTVEETRQHPEQVAGKGIDDVVGHYAEIIRRAERAAHRHRALLRRPDRRSGCSGRTWPPRPWPSTRRRSRACTTCPRSAAAGRLASPCASPANREQAVSLTQAQFRYGFGNALTEARVRRAVRAVGRFPPRASPLFEDAAGQLHPRGRRRGGHPQQGPRAAAADRRRPTTIRSRPRSPWRPGSFTTSPRPSRICGSSRTAGTR